MAILGGKMKKVAYGVVAAVVGSAAFGAVHFMFLAPNAPAGDLLGIPMNVVIPFLAGAAGFAATAYIGSIKKDSLIEKVLMYGSAAVIGFGVAQYANWIIPVAPTVRARAVVPRSFAVRTPTPVAPITKMI